MTSQLNEKKHQEKPQSPKDRKAKSPDDLQTSSGVMGASLDIIYKTKKIPQPLILLLLISLVSSLLVGGLMAIARNQQITAKESVVLQRLEPSPFYASYDQEELKAYFKGVWDSQTDKFVMSIRMEGEKYEWIVAPERSPGVRHFARGEFRIDGDILVLEKKENLGYSFDEQKRWIRYMPIPFDNINIRYSLEKRNMIWAFSEDELARIKGVTGELISKSKDTEENSIIVWKKR